MSSLVPHWTSQSASRSVKDRTPRKPSIPRATVISRLHRTDLLASLIGVPPARRAMSAAFERKAAMSIMANGGSSSAVAALSLRRLSSAPLTGAPPARYSLARLRHGTHWRASGTVLTGAPPARYSLARLRHDDHCSSSAVRAVYSAADSRPGGTWSPESSWILKSHPAPYGSEFTRPGSSSISGLTSVTSPSTGL